MTLNLGIARALRDVAVSMMKAVDERKPDTLADLSGTLDKVCESCHKVFWHPPETPKSKT